LDFDMQERLPGPGQADALDDPSTPEADRERRAPPPPADSRTPATAGSQAPAGCDCSCAGCRQLLPLMDAINMDPQRNRVGGDSARQAACFVSCGASYARCEDDD